MTCSQRPSLGHPQSLVWAGQAPEERARETNVEAVEQRFQLPHSKKSVCLFVCFVKLIFLYIYFTTELNVWPST